MTNAKAWFFSLIGFLLILFLIVLILPRPQQELFLAENGVVESLTFIFYLVCLALIIKQRVWGWIRSRWHLLAIVALLALREADFHVLFTGQSIFRTRLYVDPETPFMVAASGMVVIILILWLFLYVLRKYGLGLVKDIKNRVSSALFILMAILLVLFSKSIDGITRKLGVFNIEISKSAEFSLMQLEEISELGIPLSLCIAVVLYFSQRQDF